MRRVWTASFALTALLAAPRASEAQPDEARAGAPPPRDRVSQRRLPALVGRPAIEWTAAAIGAAVWLSTGALFKRHIAPTECRWCEANAFDSELRSLRWSDPQPADVASDVISYGIAPLVAGGLVSFAAIREQRASELSIDLVIVAEAAVAAGLTGEALRYTTGRERPSAHERAADDKPMTSHREDNLSFVSGHAAISFALAVASGTVAQLRRRRMAPIIWATGLTLAAATSYLRVAADEHYATDVLAGAALGAGLGLAFPLLHRAREGGAPLVAISPARGGAMLVLVWR